MRQTFLRGAANRGRSRLFRRGNQMESRSAGKFAGKIACPTTDSDLCADNPGCKKYAVLLSSGCSTFFRGGSRAGASTYPTFDAKMGGIGFHLGSI
jgi:hypothetical protein